MPNAKIYNPVSGQWEYFVIGKQGPTGDTGPQGPSGTVSVTAPLTNTGTSSAAVLGLDVNAYLPNVAGKNAVINGGFDFWQRGTSFTNPNDGTFTADRWVHFRDGTGATLVISQQPFTPGAAPVAGYESPFFLRYAVTAAGSSNTYRFLDNRIEDVRTFAGQTVTVSFWAKADSARSVSAAAVQNFGSGGSGDAQSFGAFFSVTTSWQRFTATGTVASVSGKTIGAGSYLYLRLGLPAGVAATVDIWGVQLEAGSIATPFSRAGGTIQGELAACQRYYWRSRGGIDAIHGRGFAVTTGQLTISIPLPVQMRTAPSSIESANLYSSDGVAFITSGTFTRGSESTPNVLGIVHTTTGFTQFRPYFLANNNASGFIAANAEL